MAWYVDKKQANVWEPVCRSGVCAVHVTVTDALKRILTHLGLRFPLADARQARNCTERHDNRDLGRPRILCQILCQPLHHQCRRHPLKTHAASRAGGSGLSFFITISTSAGSRFFPLSSSPSRTGMAKTTKLLTSPAPGTVVKPAYVYDDGQKVKLQALREVRFGVYFSSTVDLRFVSPLVCTLALSPRQ